ncbi:MAG: hypothetical protein J1E85_06380 [Ruminococcus sp.]|nr:hypothetical protein [Ruminococcus sp.]
MRYNISDNNLKVIVDEIGEEYKDILIEKVLDDMNEIDAELINPSDLIRLDVATKSNLRKDNKTLRMNYIFSLISIFGVIYAIFGVMLMMLSDSSNIIRYNSTMMMSVVLIFIGLFMSLLSLCYIYTINMKPSNYRRKRHTISSYEVVNKWKEIEALINQLTPENELLSLSSMISYLEKTKIISKEDKERINQLLNLRNQIVHKQKIDSGISQAELRSVLVQNEKIIFKMKKLL